jgi:hypothetical protein
MPTRFEHVALSEPQMLAIDVIRDAFEQIENTLNNYCHKNRETSLALTNLESPQCGQQVD